MFQIKICGVKAVKDAQLAMLAGADAIGLNFYRESARFVTLERAAQIVKVLPAKVAKIGVFVNETSEEINQIAADLKLDGIQVHGDEPPELLAELTTPFVVRAFRFRHKCEGAIGDYLTACQQLRLPDAVLVDAYHPDQFGGTGESVDWHTLAANRQLFRGLPLILAGGLTPFNVAEAIATVNPSAVDSASGIESEPGNKDPMLVRAFVQAAKKAFAAQPAID